VNAGFWTVNGRREKMGLWRDGGMERLRDGERRDGDAERGREGEKEK